MLGVVHEGVAFPLVWCLLDKRGNSNSDERMTLFNQCYYDLFEAAGLSWKKTSNVNPTADAKAVAAKKPRSSGYWHVTETRSKLGS